MFLVVVVVENDPALGSWCRVELMWFLFVDFLDSVLCLDFVERNLLSDRSPKALILICLLVVREMLRLCVLLVLLGHISESLIFIFELGTVTISSKAFPKIHSLFFSQQDFVNYKISIRFKNLINPSKVNKIKIKPSRSRIAYQNDIHLSSIDQRRHFAKQYQPNRESTTF